MKSSDISLALTIFFLFFLLLFVNVLLVGKKNIQNNWDVYKCNPMILMFSGQFLNRKLGATINPPIVPVTGTGDNYNDFTNDQRNKFANASIQKCVESIGGNVMTELQNPINSVLDSIISVGSSIVTAFMFALSFFNVLKDFVVKMIDTVFKIITSSYIAMMTYSQKTQGILSRYVITMQTMLNVLSIGTQSVNTIYKNWPVEKIFDRIRELDQLPVPQQNGMGQNTKRTKESY